MTTEETAAALVACGEALYHLAVGPSVRAQDTWATMTTSSVGDLVLIEHVRRDAAPIDRVGRLVSDEVRPPEGDALRGPRVWTIRTLDGREVEWTNVLVLALPALGEE